MNAAEERLQEVLAAFDFGAPVVGALRYGQRPAGDGGLSGPRGPGGGG